MKYKGRIIALSIVCPLCAALGGTIGWVVGTLAKPKVSFAGTYKQDLDAYNKMKEFLDSMKLSEKDLSSVDFTSKAVLNNISIGDIAGYIEYKYCNQNEYTNYVACSKAVSGSLNNQTVISEYIQNGKLRSRENVCTSSSGLVAFGEITYNFDSEGNINSSTQPYQGKYDYYRCPSDVTFDENNKTCSANYTTRSRWSDEKLVETVSSVPEFPFGYNIKEASVKKDTWETKDYNGNEIVFDNRIEKSGENYVLYVNLNEIATETLGLYSANSTRDQNNLASMKKPPTYTHCGVKITATKDLKILNLKSCEDYKVYTTLATAGTLGYCNVIYSYEKKELHKVNTSTINYYLAEAGL